jgi:hypothetical protein
MTTLRDIIDAMTPNAGQEYEKLLDMPIFVKQNDEEDDDTVLSVILGYEDLTVTVDVGGTEYESILLEFDGNVIGGIVHD